MSTARRGQEQAAKVQPPERPDTPPPPPPTASGGAGVHPATRTIAGYCPMGCGETLFVGKGGYLTCSALKCPRPDAVSDLLADNETGHIVELKEHTFTVRHPLKERLDDALLQCTLSDYLRDLDGPPVPPGRYRARPTIDGWSWQAINVADGA